MDFRPDFYERRLAAMRCLMHKRQQNKPYDRIKLAAAALIISDAERNDICLSVDTKIYMAAVMWEIYCAFAQRRRDFFFRVIGGGERAIKTKSAACAAALCAAAANGALFTEIKDEWIVFRFINANGNKNIGKILTLLGGRLMACKKTGRTVLLFPAKEAGSTTQIPDISRKNIDTIIAAYLG